MKNVNKNVCSYASLSGKNAKTVDQLIEQAITSAKSMREKVQIAGVAILMHAEKHGDYSKAQLLVDGLGNGINGAALVEWFVQYGGLIVAEEGTGFSGWKGAGHIKNHFEKAKSQAWWELKKQNPYKGYNLLDDLTNVIKRGTAALDKVEEAETSGDDELLHYLKSVINVDVESLRKVALVVEDISKAKKAA